MLAGPGPDAEDRLDIVLRMHARQLLDRGGGRLGAREAGEGRVVERRQDGAQPVGPLGMMGAGVVLEAGRMGEQEGHVRLPLRDAVWRKGPGSSATRIGAIRARKPMVT